MGIIAAFMVPHPPLIVPDIGRGEERKIQKTINAYKKVAERIRELEPETIVLMSPHQVMYADYFHISPGKGAKGDFGQFGIGQVKMEAQYDQVFVENLCKLADARDLPAGTMGERDRHLDHGTMVPLYFINQYWKQYKLVRIGLSGFPLTKHYELGQCIKETAEVLGRKVVLIASGDLSHRLKAEGPYGFQAEGPVYDERIMDVMGRAAFGEWFGFSEEFCEKAAECGHRPFTNMAGALDRMEVVPERMAFEGALGAGHGARGHAVCGSNPERNFLDK